MLFLFASVMLFGLSLCGVGSLFGRLFFVENHPRNPFIFFWFGIFIASTLSMLGSLFVPINMIWLIAFIVIGAAGLPFFYRDCKQLTAQCGNAETKVFKYAVILFLTIITFMFAYKEWVGTLAIDTPLYHAQIIRWHNEYGTPPGLGNLHYRLAMNSSWLSLAALFDNGIWDGRSAWLMLPLAYLGGIVYFLYELIFARKSGIRLYALCILAYICIKIIERTGLPELTYDTPPLMLNAVIVLEAYYLLSGYARNLSKKETSSAAVILMLSVSAFMMKPIGAVSLLFVGLLTLFLLVRNTKQTASSWFVMLFPALCAFAVWVARNIFLSGYPVYPLPVLAMPFDWTMPPASLDDMLKAITGYARMPSPDYLQSLENGFLFWFKPWVVYNLRFKFLILVAFPFLLLPLFWFFAIRFANTKKALFFLAWTFSSIIYWFIMAPDYRFGDGFFWACLGSAFLFSVPDNSQFVLSDFWKKPNIRIAFYYLLGMLIVSFAIVRIPFISNWSFLTIETMPSRPMKEFTVNADPPFTVWIPEGNDGLAGNSPLPNAPGPSWLSNLEMREPGNLGKGFRPIHRRAQNEDDWEDD